MKYALIFNAISLKPCSKPPIYLYNSMIWVVFEISLNLVKPSNSSIDVAPLSEVHEAKMATKTNGSILKIFILYFFKF